MHGCVLCIYSIYKHHMPIARFQALSNHWLNIMISNWLRHILMATWHAICSKTKIHLAWLDWCFVNQKSNAKIGNHFMNATTAPHRYCVCVVNIIDAFDGSNQIMRCSVCRCLHFCCGKRSNINRMRCRSTERLDYRSFIDIRHQRASTKIFWLDWSRTYINYILYTLIRRARVREQRNHTDINTQIHTHIVTH